MSRCGAKRPSGDSSSTCRWAPQGMDWALQAGILSIQPLQAAWETGDGATDSLYLLDYCWESVLGGTAGLTGISANKFCIFASSLPAQRLPESFFSLFISNLLSLLWPCSVSHRSLHNLHTIISLSSHSFARLWWYQGTPTLATCCPLL